MYQYLKTYSTMLFCVYSIMSMAQSSISAIMDYGQCGRVTQSKPEITIAANLKMLTDTQRRSSGTVCQYTMTEIAALTKKDLLSYITQVSNPRSCIYNALYSFNSTLTPQIFSKEKVDYISSQTLSLIEEFDGSNDNGVVAAMIYLSLAGQHESFYINTLDQASWDQIQEACLALIHDETYRNQSDTSLYAIGHMFYAAAFHTVAVHPDILDFAAYQLHQLANDSYESIDYKYPYYYSYYYLIDVFLRYPTDHSSYIDLLDDRDSLLVELGHVATNLNLTEEAFLFFPDLVDLGIDGLVRHAPYEVLQDVVGPALTDVTDTYPDDDPRWIKAAIGMVDNDMPFDITREQIIDNLMSDLFPHTYDFDDGQIQIQTPLSYERALSLYQSTKQVKAQFFRLLGTHHPLAEDTNDTLYVKVHGTKASYQDYNHILFGINYPNSGGVYIEEYGTFYTFERTPEESSYTLEELFRHEYTHYLQGRYLVDGIWGQSAPYSDNRLVWYEEGMAQYLAGSDRHGPIRSLAPTRQQVINDQGLYPTISEIFSSAYGGTPSKRYYVYAPMLWKYLYQKERGVALDLFATIRANDLDRFDALIDSLGSEQGLNDDLHTYIATQIHLPDEWIHPETQGIPMQDISLVDLQDLSSEAQAILPELDIQSIHVDNVEDPRSFIMKTRHRCAGHGTQGHIHREVSDSLDYILSTLESSAYNNFSHTTASFDAIEINGDEAIITLYITGPLNDACRAVSTEDFEISSLGDERIRLSTTRDDHPIHQYRYRQMGAQDWIELASSQDPSVILTLPLEPSGYEFQYQELCTEDIWTGYTDGQAFQHCPDEWTYVQDIAGDATIQASIVVDVGSNILPGADLALSAGSGIGLSRGFEVYAGSRLTAQISSCKD